jgi:hypothetical protein
MKTRQAKQFDSQPRPQSLWDNGFALVITLILLILLTVIGVALLTLSSISLRTIGKEEARATAQANARLALLLAIGDLQKSAGPDRRVTATADIRESTVNAEKLHWTGVWSTANWDVNKPTLRTFAGWLASDPALLHAAANENQVDSAMAADSVRSRRVTLVGSGSLGSLDAAHVVKMLTVPIAPNGTQPGTYAYWVGDEGVKARYDLTESTIDSDTTRSFTTAARWAAPPHSGIQKIQGMEAYLGLPDASLRKTTTYEGIQLVQSSASASSAVLPPNLFHHLTTDSIGLPVDVRMGGPKQDLSLAFELPLADFNALVPFHLDKETNSTAWYNQLNQAVYSKAEFYPSSQKLGYLFLIPEDASGTNRVRGPTWDLLRNHYRLYKKEWEAFSWPRKLAASGNAMEARGSLPFSYASNRGGGVISGRFTNFSGESMLYSRSMKGAYSDGSVLRQRPAGTFDPALDPLRRTAEKITPLVTRMTFVFGLAKGVFAVAGSTPIPGSPETIAVSIDPYITLFNPYNRPIEFHSFGCYAAKFNPFVYSIEYTDAAGASQNTSFDSSANSYNYGSFSFRLNPSTTPGGIMRLEPGEVRVISPEKVMTGGIKIDRNGATPLSGTSVYSEDSGIAIIPGSPVIPKTGTTVTLKIRGRASNPGWQEIDMMDFSMFYPKLHAGQARDVVLDIPPVAGVFTDTDSMDDPHVLKMGFSTYPAGGVPFSADRAINASQIPAAGQKGQFVAALDMYMKDFKGDVPVFAQFNPRATAVDPRDYDGSHRVSPGWEVKFSPITDISELNLVTASNQGRWGGRNGTTSYLCLYDIPSAPLTSLAQLQHADIGAFPTDAPYAIGNSFPPPAIPLGSLFGTLRIATADHIGWGPQSQADICWASNEMIWDRYFFSGLHWGGSATYSSLALAATAMSDPASKSPFINSRVALGLKPANPSRLNQFDTLGDYLVINGAFNINSTSETAWKAVLASLDQVELSRLVNGESKTGKFNSPLTRFTSPAGDDSDAFRGFRALTDAQLDALSKAIVDQIKLRGPFMGLSDFVNRRLDTTAYGKCGALQAAIDASSINSALPGTPSAGNLVNPIPSTQAGLPGFVTQADLLSTIGSFISARSDTFKIRAYGEAMDQNGKVLARAWCEAVVQRTPEWMEPTNKPATIANSEYPSKLTASQPVFRPYVVNTEFPAVNQNFGRRFKIMQFRWLSDRDV